MLVHKWSGQIKTYQNICQICHTLYLLQIIITRKINIQGPMETKLL